MRTALVISAIWIAVAGYSANEWAVRRASQLTNVEIDACLATHIPTPHPSEIWTPCWEKFDERFLGHVWWHWLIVGLVTLLPVMLGWAAGYVWLRK